MKEVLYMDDRQTIASFGYRWPFLFHGVARRQQPTLSEHLSSPAVTLLDIRLEPGFHAYTEG